MNKLGRKYYEKVRKDINARYIAGESVPDIAAHYEINARTAYYYLRDVTPEEKGLHIKNNYLQKLEKQQHGNQEENKKSSKKAGRIKPKTKYYTSTRGFEIDETRILPGSTDESIRLTNEFYGRNLKLPIVRRPGTAFDPEQFITTEPDTTSNTESTEASLADFVG